MWSGAADRAGVRGMSVTAACVARVTRRESLGCAERIPAQAAISGTALLLDAARPELAWPRYPLLPVSACGAPTGFDSGEPRWRRKTERIAIDPIARNSDCQFCSVRFQKSAVVTYVDQDTVAA